MDKLAREWKKRFETVWDPEGQGKYRMGSPGQRMIKYFIQHHKEGQKVNEYGSGTGRAVMALLDQRPGTKINMVDIAENAMEDPCRKALEENPDLTFTLAPLWKLPKDFPSADWGLCIEVLCFVPPEKLDACLREIRRTCRNLFVQVYDWQDRRCGYDLTTIIMDGVSWRKKFMEFWRVVDQIPHPETPRRFLFVCR